MERVRDEMKTVLFDFDGTLADSIPFVVSGLQRVFAEYTGKSYTSDEIIAMFGPTEENMIRLKVSLEVSAAIERFFELYEQMHTEEVILFKGLQTLLQDLKQNGFQVGLVTGKSKRGTLISLQHYGLLTYFDVVVTGDDVKEPKPHPEPVEKALHALSAEPQETYFVGDSFADIRAGQAAGVTTIGVQWFSTVQGLGSEKPDYLVQSIEELRGILGPTAGSPTL